MSARARLLALAALALTLVLAPAADAATIIILNGDSTNEGFNDPTPVAPVGGNPGTTLGAQRLYVFQHAADIWGGILPSAVNIVVTAKFDPLACDATSAVLGSAGPVTVAHDFTGAIFGNTWYHIALANKLHGSDLDPTGADISAQFNSTLDNGTCLGGAKWYYGVDGNEGSNVELLPVVLHEMGHGLGFSTLVNLSSQGGAVGGQFNGRPDLFEHFLRDDSSGLHWTQMSNAQRAASAVNTGNLVWDGASTTTHAGQFLGPKPIVHVDAPAGIAGDEQFGTATFGPALSSPGVSGTVVLVNDGSGTTSDACEPLVNGGALAGNIALIDRGTCAFVDKAAEAEAAGAIAVVIADNVANEPPPYMGGTDPGLTIPVVSITLADGNAIKSNLPNVTMTLGLDAGQLAGTDGSGRPLMYAPASIELGSSVSHWDVSETPSLLMEPFISNELSSSVDLTRYVFDDLGWTPVVNGVPPAPQEQPIALALQNAPNPFGTSTTIGYALDRAADTKLEIFDLGGRRVRLLENGWSTAGDHAVTWDGADDHGARLAPGVYLCRLEAGSRQRSQRIVLLP